MQSCSKGNQFAYSRKNDTKHYRYDDTSYDLCKRRADGIAAINIIKSITNIDPITYVPLPEINGKSAVSGYSGKAVKPIALRFIADLAKCEQLNGIPLSGMGGIETWQDGLEFILLGCRNLQVTTSVMQYGYRIIEDLLDGLMRYMAQQGFQTIDEMVGLSLETIAFTDGLDRNSIIYPKLNFSHCVGCGRCYLACFDSGHQAIEWEAEKKSLNFM